MSQHDEPEPSRGQPPADDSEDTRPLWPRGHDASPDAVPQQGAQPGSQQGAPQGPQQGPGPWAPPSAPYPPRGGYAQEYPTMPMPGLGYPPPGSSGGPPVGPRRTSTPPGWVWPLVAVTALVVGLLGGTLGGVAVSTTMSGSDGGLLTAQPDTPPAPVPSDNGSVAAVAAKLLPSTVQVLTDGGADGTAGGGATGSGFVIDSSGHVITNNHVVADATDAGAIQVVDHAGRAHAARIVGRSPTYDIAVLQVQDAQGLRPANLGSSRSMRVGETVVAFGSPLGLDSTVTSGIISALNRPVTTGNSDQSSYINAVQTDAAINPGNSGGPLVNLRGQVIGVNSAIATMGSPFAGESGSIGVGFAIPMEQVRVTAAQILRTGEAKYPVIGANVNTGAAGAHGAKVVGVPSGTPADRAGLQQGDVVVAVDGEPVTDGIGLIVAIRSHQPGETITLTVLRDGSRRTLRITLDAKVG